MFSAAMVVIAVCGMLGIYVATVKGRPPGEGILLGMLLGPLGVLIVALLPTQPLPQAPVRKREKDTWTPPARWNIKGRFEPSSQVDPSLWDLSEDPRMPKVVTLPELRR
jgi:hypothetical protein